MFTGLYTDGSKCHHCKPTTATSYLCIQMSASEQSRTGPEVPIAMYPWAASHVLQQSTGTIQAQLHQPGLAPSRMFGWWMCTPCSTTCFFPWLLWLWTQKGVRENIDNSITLMGIRWEKQEHSRKHHIPSKRR